jgi:phosphoribosylaminoimidazole-succinocarboxamide synthase
MVVKKADVIPIECVVRGYIVGGGWKEYQQIGSVSGVKLAPGLKLADKLPEPIFTPSTKATAGHDEPISFDQACAALESLVTPSPQPWWTYLGPTSSGPTVPWGESAKSGARMLMQHLRARSLAIYKQAAELAAKRGIIIADTKFEFGLLREGGRSHVLLIDEVLTPDSSRFWPADQWKPGGSSSATTWSRSAGTRIRRRRRSRPKSSSRPVADTPMRTGC